MSDYVDVSDMDEDYRKAKNEQYDSGVPDGIYEATIEKVRFAYTQNGNDRYFEWIFRTTDQDERIRKVNLLRKELLHWLKSDLATCGWIGTSLSEIQQKANVVLSGLHVKLKVETKEVKGRMRQNVTIQKCFDPLPAPSESERNPGDDFPF